MLGHKNASQRKKIKEAYQQLYDKSLIDDLHSELSGDFRIFFFFSSTHLFILNKFQFKGLAYELSNVGKINDISKGNVHYFDLEKLFFYEILFFYLLII